RAVRDVAVNAGAKTVTLTLATAVTRGQSVTVTYDDPRPPYDDPSAIQDIYGQDAASFTATAVLNNTPSGVADTTPPVFHSAVVNGDQLVISYTEANRLDGTALAGNAGFAVSSSTGTAITVNSAVVNAAAKTVTLTLSRAVTRNETLSVRYTKPESGAVVQDAAGNDAVSFSDQAVTNDTPATGGPTLAATDPITIGDNNLSLGESTTVTIRFSEAISGFTTADLVVGGGAHLSDNLRSTDGGITWTVTLTAPGWDDFTRGYARDPNFDYLTYNSTGNQISVNLAGVTNSAGTAGAGRAVSTVTYDINVLNPYCTIRLADSTLTAGETTTATFSFSEPVNGFEVGDFDLSRANGTLGPLTLLADGKTWTATFTPNANVNAGGNTIRLDMTRVSDLAGNAPRTTSVSYEYNIDTRTSTAAPDTSGLSATIWLSDWDQRLTTGETTILFISFNRPVTGFTRDDIDLTQTHGTLSEPILSADGRTWSAIFTPTAGVIDETNTISVNLAGVTDAAGVAGTGRATSDNFILTTAPPDATITLADSALTVGETTTVTINFNQMVYGFSMADVVFDASTSTLGALTTRDRKTWTASLTPTADLYDRTNTIRVNLAGVTDLAGKPSTGMATSANYTVNTQSADTTPPVFHSAMVNGDQLVLTYTEANRLDGAALAGNAGFTVNTAAGAVAITVSSAVVNATAKTVTLTLSRAVANTETVTVSYTKPESGNGVRDAAGNQAANFSAKPVAADTTPPEISTAVVTGNQLVLTYTEAGTLDGAALAGNAGFTVITAAGATAITVSSAVVNATAKTVTLTLSRTVAATETVVVRYIKPESGNGVRDAAGNQAENFNGVIATHGTPAPADTTAPEFHSAAVTGNQLVLTYTEANTLDAAALAGNAGFAVSSTTGTAITVNSAVVSATDKTVTLTLSRAVAATETVTVRYTKPESGAVVQDAAGNDAVSFSDQAVTNNTPAGGPTPAAGGPTLAATDPITIGDDKLSLGESTTVTIRFSEAVSGFTTADLVVGGGAHLSDDLRSTDGGSTWTVTLTAPNADDLARVPNPRTYNSVGNQISVNLAGVSNSAGTAGAGQAVSRVTYEIDVIAPDCTIRLGDSALTAGETTTALFRFSEPVTGFELGDIDLSRANGTLGPLTPSANGRTWTATFTPTANVNAGGNTIGLDLSRISDLAGNVPRGTAVSRPYSIDTRTSSATRDMDGQEAASRAAPAVLNDTRSEAADTTPPAFHGATVTGNQLVLTYTEAGTLNGAALAGSAGFAVNTAAGTAAITVSSAVVSATAKTVTLTLSRAVTHGETVSVS
ncbi:SwmB domain-containing protein, partial [Verminephrobacter aporrectodeae]|uniref:SwmB domain-containing protein n=1 Tax=Verminephrobacter aporrectodeae TaxID=1110389 RepID=UPI000237702F